MAAKDSLLETLCTLRDCLGDPALVDRAPADVFHNLRAAMLRQGLAVLTFSAVESFIRERTGEVLQTFDNARVTFSDLSSALQKAVTLGALEGVRFRLKLQPQQDKINWLVASLTPIARATTDVSQLSEHSFAHASSNLDEDAVKDILRAFGIEDPWQQITQLTSRLGVALLDSKSEFAAIKERRHASAHSRATQVPHADLLASAKASLAICIAFDLLLSHSRGLHNLGQWPGVAGRSPLAAASIALVFVAPRAGTRSFVLRREQLPPPAPVLARPTVRVFSDESAAISYGTTYAQARRSQLVIVDQTSTPSDWTTW